MMDKHCRTTPAHDVVTQSISERINVHLLLGRDLMPDQHREQVADGQG
jgi:hypothetical protein